MNILIADSGATKCHWCYIKDGKKKHFYTIGISPYFLSQQQIVDLLLKTVVKKINNESIDSIHFYGTGLSNPENKKQIETALKAVFKKVKINVETDILAASRALCGKEHGVVCILGTGSNCCYYNGKKIIDKTPSLGYVLGDEGSGAYLGRKVLQHYLYNTFDEELLSSFNHQFNTNRDEILNQVYKQPLANKYLASFAIFLQENRGHYMIENIIEDGLNDFFIQHIFKLKQSWLNPIHFVGSVAYGFKDILKEICNVQQLSLGKIVKEPMDGLINFHINQ